jgi:Major Vault Protein repeat domain
VVSLKIESKIVLPNEGLFLQAKKDTVDTDGVVRKAGSSVSVYFCGDISLVAP